MSVYPSSTANYGFFMNENSLKSCVFLYLCLKQHTMIVNSIKRSICLVEGLMLRGWQRGGREMIFKVLSNSKHSMI